MSSTTAPLFPAGTRPLQGQRDASAGGGGGGGSYTPVFVVLGVIAALLVISCFVGQICTKKHLRHRPRRDRVAYYNDDDTEVGGFGPHGPHHHSGHGIARVEAPAASVETRAAAAGDGAAVVAAQGQQTAT